MYLIGFPEGSSIGSTIECRGSNPPLYCTLTLIAMQVHQNKGKIYDKTSEDRLANAISSLKDTILIVTIVSSNRVVA